jgi:hypothetical protein
MIKLPKSRQPGGVCDDWHYGRKAARSSGPDDILRRNEIDLSGQVYFLR